MQLPEVGEVLTVEVAVLKMMASAEVLLEMMASAEVLLEEFLVKVLVFLLVAAVSLLVSLRPAR